MTGTDLIAQERLEQKVKHHRSVHYDVESNGEGQLTEAAIHLLVGENNGYTPGPPRGWNTTIWKKMMGKERLERLIIAGALIAAEIDRLKFEE